MCKRRGKILLELIVLATCTSLIPSTKAFAEVIENIQQTETSTVLATSGTGVTSPTTSVTQMTGTATSGTGTASQTTTGTQATSSTTNEIVVV